MLSRLKKKQKSGLTVGLGFHAEGISVVVMDVTGEKPSLRHCSYTPVTSDEAIGKEIARILKESGARNSPTTIVLEPGDYSLLQVEAPEVAPDELAQAIRWRVKDLLNFHIDDAILDVFDMPTSSRRNSPNYMQVVAAKKGHIQQLVDRIEELDLELVAIDITELSLRNVLSRLVEDPGYRGLLYLAPTYGMIQINQEQTVYLNRRIETDGTELEEIGGFTLNETLDSLVLELQRSMDYFESQFPQSSVKSFYVVAPESRLEQLAQMADQGLSAWGKPLNLAAGMEGADEVPMAILNRCLPAIGAALREQ